MEKDISRKVDLNKLEQEYRELYPLGDDLRIELQKQLQGLLDDNAIVLGFPIQSRIKSWQSISEKLNRVSLSISSIKELQDFVGLRLHLLFRKDLPKVINIIRETFNIVREYDTQARLKEDQFGYASIHFVVSLPETWLAIPTLSRLKHFQAEIQVRTLAQHIWAETSQALQYKMESSVPTSMRRSIYRISALLETIDLEFDRLLKERDGYRERIRKEEVEEGLNVDLLEQLLDKLLPPGNKDEKEDYAILLQDLNAFEVTTYKGLERLIKKHQRKVFEEERKLVHERREELREKGRVFGTSPERINRGVYFTHVGLTRVTLCSEFGEAFGKYMKQGEKKKDL